MFVHWQDRSRVEGEAEAGAVEGRVTGGGWRRSGPGPAQGIGCCEGKAHTKHCTKRRRKAWARRRVKRRFGGEKLGKQLSNCVCFLHEL